MSQATEITLREWLRRHPPGPEAFEQTLAAVARATLAGEEFRTAVRELLDEFNLLPDDALRRRAIEDEPPPTGDPRFDAFLAALAEHLAHRWQLARPTWSVAPERFLGQFWFVSEVAGFRALAVAQSPAAFRRRGIFISAAALERV